MRLFALTRFFLYTEGSAGLSCALKGPRPTLAHRLFGKPDFGNLEARLVNILSFGGGLAGMAAAIENAAIGGPWILILGCALQGTFLLSGYVLSRFYGRHRAALWPVMFVILAFLCLLFFFNAGSSGGAQYFFFLSGLSGAVLVRGWERVFMAALHVAAMNAVLGIEYFYPAIIVDYRSPEDRYFDVAFSYTLCTILFGVVMAVVSAHYLELLRRTKRGQEAFEEDLHLARELQRRVVQVKPPVFPGFDVAVSFRPAASLGGDFYEVHAHGDGIRVLIADVTGHGINAALSSMLAKGEWALCRHRETPSAALMQWNHTICAGYGDAMTLSACVVDVDPAGRIQFASAGHGLQHVAQKGEVKILPATGILLGMDKTSTIFDQTLPAAPDARIVLFTDGLYEETDRLGNPAGIDWLSEILSSHPGPARALLLEIEKTFARRTGRSLDELADDLTIVVVEVQSPAV